MSEATSTKQRVVHIEGTPYSYRVDIELSGDHCDVTLLVPVVGGVVEHDFPLSFGGMPAEMAAQVVGPTIETVVRRIAPQIASAGLKFGDTSVTLTEKLLGAEKSRDVPIRFVSTPVLPEQVSAKMSPMTIHYQLQPAVDGEDPVAMFSVEVEGGSLSTCCMVPDANPGWLGSMAGIICNDLHMNAKYFPGENRVEARTESRHLHYANARSGETVMARIGEFDVTFTPDQA